MTDASFADSPEDRKSQTGDLLFVYGNLVGWKSNRQGHIATSPQHADTNACDQGARNLVWVRKLLEDICDAESTPSVIFVDNKGLISSTITTPRHQSNKHLDVKLFYKNELQTNGTISIQYIETSRLPADALTKQLPFPAFTAHADVLLGRTYMPERDGIPHRDATLALRNFEW